MKNKPCATAVNLTTTTDKEGFPASAAWEQAPAERFCADWQGKNPDSRRETQVQLLWSRERLYLRFQCRFREVSVFPDAAPNGRRDAQPGRQKTPVVLTP